MGVPSAAALASATKRSWVRSMVGTVVGRTDLTGFYVVGSLGYRHREEEGQDDIYSSSEGLYRHASL